MHVAHLLKTMSKLQLSLYRNIIAQPRQVKLNNEVTLPVRQVILEIECLLRNFVLCNIDLITKFDKEL